ncbi:MAG: DNA-binding protein WhiA [Candidatus Limnocylindria bacterium]
MVVASEIKGELARIQPARACCQRAELAGLVYGADDAAVITLDHATARIAVHLAAALGIPADSSHHPALPPGRRRQAARHHLRVAFGAGEVGAWSWANAEAHDRRAFLRGVLLGHASISFTGHGAHLELVFGAAMAAGQLRAWLAETGIGTHIARRRRRHVVYVKGQEEIATLLRVTGANRGLLDLESRRVGRDVRNRLNRLLNAEEANLARSVAAADRQLQAIDRLEAGGELARLPPALREAAAQRRQHPDAALEAVAAALGVSRSAANHRLRRLVELAEDGEREALSPPRRRMRGRSA